MKHNKKRNTAFLYESLVKEMTKAILRSDASKKNIITGILKEHFHANSILQKELSLYKTLSEVHSVQKETAEKILSEVKRVYHSLGEEEIFDEQTKVIKKINTDLGKSIYSNFVSNYKTIASISQMFNNKTPISNRIILENNIVELMSKAPEKRREMKPIDNITYNIFVEKFNEKYGNSLNESQKDLLSRYVTLSPENSVEFKMFLSDEINRLKHSIAGMKSKKEVVLDEGLMSKSKEIYSVLDGFKEQKINDDMIKKILKIQALVSEA